MTTVTPSPALDPVSAAWLAGGLPRAVDALLVARLEDGRVRVVDGSLVDRGLRPDDPFDAALLDALGARRRRDVETVRWRVSRDRRLEVLRSGLQERGLLAARTSLGLRDRPERPARTATGRRLLRELRAAPLRAGAWEVALHGRDALTDLSLRTALVPPPRPEAPRARWRMPSRAERAPETYYAVGGAGTMAFGGGFGGIDGGGGCGGGDGGGC